MRTSMRRLRLPVSTIAALAAASTVWSPVFAETSALVPLPMLEALRPVRLEPLPK